jgi:hypothetical protein
VCVVCVRALERLSGCHREAWQVHELSGRVHELEEELQRERARQLVLLPQARWPTAQEAALVLTPLAAAAAALWWRRRRRALV